MGLGSGAQGIGFQKVVGGGGRFVLEPQTLNGISYRGLRSGRLQVDGGLGLWGCVGLQAQCSREEFTYL